MEYTISQAMRYAATLKAKLSEIKKRASSSLVYKKDSSPPFSFEEQEREYQTLSYQLAKVKGALAVANSTTTIKYKDESITLSHAINMLQEVKGYIAWLKELPCLPSKETNSSDRTWDDANDKYITNQVITCCVLPERIRAEKVDSLQASFDELNWLIESKNQVTKFVID
jgi:hypothetical protein